MVENDVIFYMTDSQTPSQTDFCKDDFSYEELINFLESPDQEVKKLGLLKIDFLKNKEHALLLCSCLINNPSETREYASFTINKLIQNEQFTDFFQDKEVLNIFQRAIFDVNPKICRNIIDVLHLITDKEFMVRSFIDSIYFLFEQMEEKNKKKNHVYDKFSFHLYWNLYALAVIICHAKYCSSENLADIVKILDRTTLFKEYTIRERGAFLLLCMEKIGSQKDLELLRNVFINDKNFYVRSMFTRH